MDSKTIVDVKYEDYKSLLEFLNTKQQLTFEANVNSDFSKILLLTVASYFEYRLTDVVVEFVKKVTYDNHVLVHLIQRKAVSRQYHTWFDWDKNNANSFFSLFGEDFKKNASKIIQNDTELESAIQSFLEIGRERNMMVHGNFGNYSVIKTSDEIYDAYKRAAHFVDWFPRKLREFQHESSTLQFKDNE